LIEEASDHHAIMSYNSSLVVLPIKFFDSSRKPGERVSDRAHVKKLGKELQLSWQDKKHKFFVGEQFSCFSYFLSNSLVKPQVLFL